MIRSSIEPQPNSTSTNGHSPAKWQDADQVATSLDPGASISFRFHARDLHLVLGPGPDGKPVRFRVTLDGQAREPIMAWILMQMDTAW